MLIRVSRAHFPVTVLGPGRRLGIWLQGCSIGCRGCISRDTWDPDGGRAVTVEELVAWCRAQGPDVDGVTLSGGEPFEQPQALDLLLQELHGWRAELEAEVDFLCYSGYSLRRLRQHHSKLLDRLDAIVTGPFVAGRPTTAVLRGSANQELVLLSELGHRRFEDDAVERQLLSQRARIQVTAEDGDLLMIGIPAIGDMERLEEQLSRRGLHFTTGSWNA